MPRLPSLVTGPSRYYREPLNDVGRRECQMLRGTTLWPPVIVWVRCTAHGRIDGREVRYYYVTQMFAHIGFIKDVETVGVCCSKSSLSCKIGPSRISNFRGGREATSGGVVVQKADRLETEADDITSECRQEHARLLYCVCILRRVKLINPVLRIQSLRRHRLH